MAGPCWELGRRIAKVLWSEEGMRLLDEDRVWHEGMCYGLALALKKWLRHGNLWVVVDAGHPYPRSRAAEHLVLEIGQVFFDGRPKQAAHTRRNILKYYSLILKDPKLIALEGPESDRREASEVTFSSDTTCSVAAVDEIVRLLTEQVGARGFGVRLGRAVLTSDQAGRMR